MGNNSLLSKDEEKISEVTDALLKVLADSGVSIDLAIKAADYLPIAVKDELKQQQKTTSFDLA